MIRPNELRIGNYVNVPHGDVQIKHFTEHGAHFTDDCGGNWNSLEPIQLSPDWLTKFGFFLQSEAHHKFPTLRDTYDKNKIVERLDRIYKFKYEPDDIDGEDWRNIEILQVIDPNHPMKQRSMGIRKIGNKFILAGDLQNVHQLQNLYFALTGEELELKQ